MAPGIRAQIAVGSPGGCPVAAASMAVEEPITETSWSTVATDGGAVVEEFVAPSAASVELDEVTPVFRSNGRTVHRFQRDLDDPCVCKRIEGRGCPIAELRAEDGGLIIGFFAADLETVQAVVDDLSTTFEDVSIRQLSQDVEDDGSDFVFVDRSELTTRQREVLQTSLEMGYFDFPKGANAGEVAAALDISPSTYREHLAAAQRKLLGSLIE